jgi:predicted RNA-binding protein with PUA-like domain
VDEKWLAIDVSFSRWISHPIALSLLRAHSELGTMDFLRIPRLSVAALTEAQNKILMDLSQNGPHR